MLTLKLFCLIFLVNCISCSSGVFEMSDDFDEDFDLEPSEEEMPFEEMPSEFDKFKNKLLRSTELIFDEISNETQKYRNLRDSALNENKKKLDNENREILKNLGKLDMKRKKIEGIISKIQDGVSDQYIEGFEEIKAECRNKLKNLTELKSYIEYKNIHEDNEDEDMFDEMFRDAYYNQYELERINEEIDEIEKKLADSNSGKHGKLSFAYSQLVDIFKDEQKELKRKTELETVNKAQSISNIYAQNIESIYTKVKSKVENLVNDAFDVIAMLKSHDWIHFDKQIQNITINAVLGGEDIDKSPFYVIRGLTDGSFKYGKYAFNGSRKNAYLTNVTDEFEIMNSFELLTAKNYSWCSSIVNKGDPEILPICRARHQSSMIPGTLLKNNTCRVGFGWKTHIISDNFEMLSFNPCKSMTLQYATVQQYTDFDDDF